VSLVARAPAAVALCLAMLGVACGDAPTGRERDETVIVSLVGVADDDAGIVVRLTGGVELIDAAHAVLTVAWTSDETGTATVAIVGPLIQGSDVLLVRRRAGVDPLRAQVLEVANAQGAVSPPSTTRAIIRSSIH
jgi:hypothetical protein